MNFYQKMKLILFLAISFILISCNDHNYKVKNFNEDELIWFKPFNKTDTVIFISERKERDTIIFQVPVKESDSTRSYSLGYSNTNYLSISYLFSKGSYHQFALTSDGKTRFDQDFVKAIKSSTGYSNLEISFIGTFFNDSINNIKKVNDSIYFCDSNKADYSGINVEGWITNFTFNSKLGIIEYTDMRNIKWRRSEAAANTR